MFQVALIAGLVCLLGWLYLLLAHGSFWKVWRLVSDTEPARIIDGLIAVVIPARNEADVISDAVTSLLRQTCASSLRIFVVDDNSSDGTSEAAVAAARKCCAAEQVCVIQGTPLSAGWTGKLWAVQQGIDRAMSLNPTFLLLTDADIYHSPDNIAKLVATANAANYDLVSFMVRLHCCSFAERLLIPAFVFFFFMLYPPLWIRDNKKRIAGAAGGCMLVRPSALKQSGGIGAIRGEIIDDCALAGIIKRSGGRVWLGVTDATHSTRMYSSFSEIERMIARTAFNQLHHSALLLLGALVGLGIAFLLPLALLAGATLSLVVLGLASWLLMIVTYVPVVRFYRLAWSWALTLPLGAVFYMAATIHSAWKYWTGRGGDWKGRPQDVAHSH